jgi:hypothetical protein
MDATASKRLKIGERVCWDEDESDLGTVVETGYNAVKIQWENGQTGILHHNDMGQVTLIR